MVRVRCNYRSYMATSAAGACRAVMVMAAIAIVIMVMMIAVAIMIVLVPFGIARGIVCVPVIVIMVVVLVLAFECQKRIIATRQSHPLTFQQLPHLFLLPLFHVHAGIAAAGSFALLQIICLLSFKLQELASVISPQQTALVTHAVGHCQVKIGRAHA